MAPAFVRDLVGFPDVTLLFLHLKLNAFAKSPPGQPAAEEHAGARSDMTCTCLETRNSDSASGEITLCHCHEHDAGSLSRSCRPACRTGDRLADRSDGCIRGPRPGRGDGVEGQRVLGPAVAIVVEDEPPVLDVRV